MPTPILAHRVRFSLYSTSSEQKFLWTFPSIIFLGRFWTSILSIVFLDAFFWDVRFVTLFFNHFFRRFLALQGYLASNNSDFCCRQNYGSKFMQAQVTSGNSRLQNCTFLQTGITTCDLGLHKFGLVIPRTLFRGISASSPSTEAILARFLLVFRPSCSVFSAHFQYM